MAQGFGESRRKVALVSGGAQGFGRAIAHRLARDGHDIVVLDMVPAEETGELVRGEGSRYMSIQTDIASRQEVDAAADRIEAEFGSVDILIANAGIYPIVPFFDTSWQTWRRVMDVNVDGTFHLFQRFISGMVERKWGRAIVMISGSLYAPPPNFAAYAASKSAVVGLVRAVAREVGAAGVTVNAVAPPLVETPGVAAGPQRELGIFDFVLQTQAIKREGLAEDVAGPISFLASDDAQFITGQSILSDGGIHFL